jgi:hypothetical protein
MALIKCPECKKKISDQCGVCPHCGFPVGNINKNENVVGKAAKETNTVPENKKPIYKKILGYVLYPILMFISFLSDSVFGVILGSLLAIAAVFAILIGIIYVFGLIFESSPVLAICIMLVGTNIVSFCASFIWKNRKPWYFPLTLFLTICFSLMLSAAFL